MHTKLQRFIDIQYMKFNNATSIKRIPYYHYCSYTGIRTPEKLILFLYEYAYFL